MEPSDYPVPRVGTNGGACAPGGIFFRGVVFLGIFLKNPVYVGALQLAITVHQRCSMTFKCTKFNTRNNNGASLQTDDRSSPDSLVS